MSCVKCKSENVEAIGPQSSMELRRCLDCGHEYYVHCYYPIPEDYVSRHKLYQGYYTVQNDRDLIKAFIKLKSILKVAENFQLASLEKQKLEGLRVWDLGLFLDVEVEKITRKCNEQKISIEFVEVK